MSYILDALRRAEAERERGNVPGLHSQPLAAPKSEPEASTRATPWLAVGGVGTVVLLGALGWVLMGRSEAPPPAPVAAAPAPAPVPAPAPAPATKPEPATGSVPPPPRTMFPPAPLPPEPVAAPKPLPPAPAPPVAAAPPPPPPAPAPNPAPAPDRIVPLAQLPEDVRRQIPPLAIGGSIYSDNAASRLLIVGGQLLHEGDSAGPGVTLEQIRPKSAVLRWNNVRYEVSF